MFGILRALMIADAVDGPDFILCGTFKARSISSNLLSQNPTIETFDQTEMVPDLGQAKLTVS